MILIAHDPGHGDPDKAGNSKPGTSHGGLVERDWVLALAQAIPEACLGLPAGHRMLRLGAKGAPYHERARAAEADRCNLVLLHHVNAIDISTEEMDHLIASEAQQESVEEFRVEKRAKSHGLITFTIEHDSLADSVAEAVRAACPPELRRKKNDHHHAKPKPDWTMDAHGLLSRYRNRGMSAVLIEWGFATNDQDRAYLLDPANIPALVACARAGIERAVELTDPMAELAAVEVLPDKPPEGGGSTRA